MTKQGLGLAHRLRSIEVLIVLLGAVALCMIGPLRGFSGEHVQVAYFSTIALFMVPGMLLSHWFLSEYFKGAALLPVAFVLSVSLFGLMAVPALVLHTSLEAYLWVSGVIVLAFLGAAALRALLGRARRTSASSWLTYPLTYSGFHSQLRVHHWPMLPRPEHRGSTVTCEYTWPGCESFSILTISPSLIRTLETR